MVRPVPIHIGDGSFPAIPLAVGLFVSVSLLVALCAKHARQFQGKCAIETIDRNAQKKQVRSRGSNMVMMPSFQAKKSCEHESGGNIDEKGIWQKAILMGERCQPLEFSGVIYYDYLGNRIPEMPKSPRASPFTALTFQLQKSQNSC